LISPCRDSMGLRVFYRFPATVTTLSRQVIRQARVPAGIAGGAGTTR